MKVNEIFKSISGEVAGFPQGSITTFVRFHGCNLSCEFCDSKATQVGNNFTEMTIEEIIKKIKEFNCKNVILTGGEPLLQTNLDDLIDHLLWDKYSISIETNGTLVPSCIQYECCIVMDYKLEFPDKMQIKDFILLNEKDFIKFVIKGEKELQEAIKVHKQLLNCNCSAQMVYSPVIYNYYQDKGENTKKLAHTIFNELNKEGLQGIINVQLHKILEVP